MDTNTYIRELIVRLARLEAATRWEGDLNPAQRAALDYLTRANRFSRSPSHVADYLGTTRGTMSQSLKTLERKGYIIEERSETDRRSISYSLTEKGESAQDEASLLNVSLAGLSSQDQKVLRHSLHKALEKVLEHNEGRSFGLCKECAHHRTTDKGPLCALLSEHLSPEEADQICNEQTPT